MHHTSPQQNVCGVFVKLSAAKIDKVNALSDVIGDGSNIALNKFVDKVHSLTTLAGNILMKKAMGVRSPSKDMLNVVCATSIYPHERREWESKSTVKDIKIVTDDFERKPEYWFSYPEYSDNHQQLDPKCLDAHHLFVNCRVKVCKDGLEGFGIMNDAWLSVAEKFPHVISKCLVQDLLDKQSNGFAQRTFGKSVEEAMRELGYIEEANFCELIRNWYHAEDEPGIPAADRISMRIKFRQYLLDKCDLTRFPPYGKHVHGMPRSMFEGFVQHINTHLQLYGIVKGGAYNVRAVTSLANETFFGEMSDLEQTNLGCPKATQCLRLISTVTEHSHYRHNPQKR